jgi:hypothetical protein
LKKLASKRSLGLPLHAKIQVSCSLHVTKKSRAVT